MKVAGFPTSSDIYLEVDGKKVAVVQTVSDELWEQAKKLLREHHL